MAQNGWNFGIGEFLAGDAAADADAAEAELLDRVLDLLRGEIGILQGGGRERDEAIRVGGAELDQRLVLDPDQLGRGVALGPVPVRIDAERLDVDALRVHRRDARRRCRSISRPGASSGWLISAVASGTQQWACTSMVLTRLPFTTTSRRRGWAWSWRAAGSAPPPRFASRSR